MPKKLLKIACIVFGILFVLFSVLTAVSVVSEMERVNTSGGIIGGADAPTAEFLLHNSPLYYAALVALALFIVAGILLIFSSKRKK